MKKLLTLLALIPFFLNAQSLERDVTATITFGSFSTVNDSTFRGDITVNDQTNTYTGNDISTGQIVVTSSGRSYRVDAVNSQGLFTANIDLVDIQDSNYASPTGVGQIGAKTGNYGFLLFTPDNANGISQQVKSILESHNWLFLDSILQTAVAADGNIGIQDLDLTSNRTLNGKGSYDFTLDSMPEFRLNATEFFITDDSTDFLNYVGNTTKYSKANAGIMRHNSFGIDQVVMQNTNDSDELYYVVASETNGEVTVGAARKEVVGSAIYGGVIKVNPDYVNINMSDSLLGDISVFNINRERINIQAADSLVIDIGAETYDEDLNTVLAIDPSTKRVFYKTVETGIVSFDTYASGFMTTTSARYGGSATVITNPTAGQYTYTIAESAYPITIDFEGQTTSLNGANELVLVIDNTANARARIFSVQLISKSGNSQVNPFATGTNYTQSVSGYITTITLPNMNGFGVTGYKVMLR